MPFYTDHIYPHLVSSLGDPEPIRAIRRQIIPLATGEVLEIGTGSGANLVHYDPTTVSTLYALEPNRGMLRLAERQRHRTELAVKVLDVPGERIPLEDGSMDSIVSTFTLCTILGVQEAIREIQRVLRPGGTLIFCELTRAPDPAVRRGQEWWEPFHHWMYAGLYLTRDIPALLTAGGLCIERMDTAYLSRVLKSWTYSCWGTATPHVREPLSNSPA